MIGIAFFMYFKNYYFSKSRMTNKVHSGSEYMTWKIL
jgi:hypothetical protein